MRRGERRRTPLRGSSSLVLTSGHVRGTLCFVPRIDLRVGGGTRTAYRGMSRFGQGISTTTHATIRNAAALSGPARRVRTDTLSAPRRRWQRNGAAGGGVLGQSFGSPGVEAF